MRWEVFHNTRRPATPRPDGRIRTSVRLDPEGYALLDALARFHGITKSRTVEMVVERYFEGVFGDERAAKR